jgi:hypothetical protein
MELPKITLYWLKLQLNALKKAGAVRGSAEVFQSELQLLLQEKLNANEKWTLEEFFILAIAFRFIDDLLTESQLVPSICKYERMRGIIYKRYSPVCADVDELVNKLDDYYSSKLKLIKAKMSAEKILEKLEPNAWLDLIFNMGDILAVDYFVYRYEEIADWLNPERFMSHPLLAKYFVLAYSIIFCAPVKTVETFLPNHSQSLITPIFEKIIRYSAFGLNENEEQLLADKIPMCYTLTELAQKWQTNKENVVAACLSSKSFHAYVVLTKQMKLRDFNLRRTVSLIKDKIDSGDIDASYRYTGKGHARLAKTSITKGGITLEYFYSNNIIKVERDSNILIWVEPPMAQRVLGVYSQYIDSAHDLMPTIVFMRNEIHAFQETTEFKELFDSGGNIVAVVTKEENVDELERNYFKRKGDYYEICFKEKTTLLKSHVGVRYLEQLTNNAGTPIFSLDLVRLVNANNQNDDKSVSSIDDGYSDAFSSGNEGEMIDDQALVDYRNRIKIINEKIEDAEEIGDIDVREKLLQERDFLVKEINTSLNNKGKQRKFSSAAEKARQAVSKAIKRALISLNATHPELYEHFKSSLSVGNLCIYQSSQKFF